MSSGFAVGEVESAVSELGISSSPTIVLFCLLRSSRKRSRNTSSPSLPSNIAVVFLEKLQVEPREVNRAS